MFRHVAVGLDGSAHAATATELAIGLAGRLGAVVHGVHVIDATFLEGAFITDISGAMGFEPFLNLQSQVRTSLEELAATVKARFEERCRGAGVDHTFQLAHAGVVRGFLDAAKVADLLVVGQRGVNARYHEDQLGPTAGALLRRSLGRRDADATMLHFMTGSGAIDARVAGDRVSMSMMNARAMRRDLPVKVAPGKANVHFMIVGTRHAVVPMDDVTRLTADEVFQFGRTLRYDPAFAPEGANVNFASLSSDGRMYLRTYEKGVEAETLACGTGSVASAVIFAHDGRVHSPVRVVQHSGDELIISFDPAPDGATNVRMDGPARVHELPGRTPTGGARLLNQLVRHVCFSCSPILIPGNCPNG